MEPVLLSYHAPAHDLDVVARHVIGEGLAARLGAWKQGSGAEELVYASTCQRVIWMQWGGDPSGLGLGPDATCMEGPEAWRHLLCVASGLASANLGDREIPDQLMDALEEARRVGVAGKEAHAALVDVIREARRLRSRIGLADGSVSVATAALRHLENALDPGASIALVGVGPMSAYLAERLPERGFRVTLVNRTLSKADEMAKPLDLDVLPLGRIQNDPLNFHAIVSATASAIPLFTRDRWAKVSRGPLHILDLALPPDSEPELGELNWIHRVDLAAFLAETETAKAHRQEAAKAAEPLLDAAVGRLRKRASERANKRELGEARHRLEEAWQALEIEALADLDPAQREHLSDLLKRGRTLAHRALAQSNGQNNGQKYGLADPFFQGLPWPLPQGGSSSTALDTLDTLDAGVPCEP